MLCFAFPNTPEERLKEVQDQIDYCQHMLQAPSEINDDSRAFLLAEYSREVEPTKTNSKPDKSA
jgi:hypothetical protein